MSKDESFEEKKASRKEFAKKMRREAYLRAKEFKKNDPKEIARKEAAKVQRRELYQKAKERHKALQPGKKEKADLSKKVRLASELKAKAEAEAEAGTKAEESSAPQAMGEVITVDFRRSRSKT